MCPATGSMGSTVPAKRSGARASTSRVRWIPQRRGQLVGNERRSAIHLHACCRRRPRTARWRCGGSPDSCAPPARSHASKPPSSTATWDAPASAASTRLARRKSRSSRRRRRLGCSGLAPRPPEERGERLRIGQGMAAGRGRDGRGQVAVQVDIARSGDVAAQVCRPAGLRVGEIEAAIEDHDSRAAPELAQRIDVD